MLKRCAALYLVDAVHDLEGLRNVDPAPVPPGVTREKPKALSAVLSPVQLEEMGVGKGHDLYYMMEVGDGMPYRLAK